MIPKVVRCIALFSLALGAEQRATLVCSTCHPAQARPQPSTGMGHALELIPDCTILKQHPVLTFSLGKYSYRIDRQGQKSLYSVTDGVQTITVPLGWAFGLGSAGQTYVYENDGELYQSRVSFYTDINGLDVTLGAAEHPPTTLNEAAGLKMHPDEKAECFNCHATDSVQGKKLTLETLRPGVQCARCHGPVESHLEGLRTGEMKLAQMPSLKTLSAEETSNFCGQCHRTWAQIAQMRLLGIPNVRFQPYRLTNSKCYDVDDKRISCVACHNPHEEVDRIDSHYDSKCLACHAGAKPEARMCKVAKNNCAACHMPKVELPGSHHKFSDHQIRVVRANESYPN